MANSDNKTSKTPHTYKYSASLRNIVIIFICVLGMGGGLWFFGRDILNSKQQQNERPVGTVYWVNNTVKRLSVHRLQWERLERYSPIYDRDIIITAAFSDVKISFINGEILELSESTSVCIKYLNQEIPSVDLLEGEIEVQSNLLNLTVSITEDLNNAGSAKYKYMVNLDPKTSAGIKTFDSVSLKVYQGSGTVTSAGKHYNISAGETLKADNDGLFYTASGVIMVSPRNGTRLLRTSQGKRPVKFEWQSRPQNDNSVILEISETRDFSSLTGRWNWNNIDSSEVELSEGTYYWKLYTPSSRENFDSGRLEIVHAPASRALSPADGSVVYLQPGKRDLRFSWIVPEEAEAVLLEVADNPEMNRPRMRQLIKRTKDGRGTYKSSELGPGQWYWRIHPIFPGRILEQAQYYTSAVSALSSRNAGYANSDMVPVEFPSEIKSFSISEITEQPVNRNRSSVLVLRPGSTPRHIFPPDNYTLDAGRTPDLLFTWRSPISRGNRFQIAEYLDFASSVIVDEEIIGSNFQSPFLKPGFYYWRVVGADPEYSSRPSRLVVIPSLPGPSLETPAGNERLLIEEGVPIKFSWEQVNYANYYIFSLFLAGREQPLREVSAIQNNSVMVYFDPRTTGWFRWTVQGFTSPTEITTGRNGLISQSYFNINLDTPSDQGDQISWTIPRIANMQAYYGEVDSPIKLISPISGVNIPGVQALRSPPEARWSSEEPLRNIQLIVSRTTDPSSDPRAIVKDASGTSVVFPSLSEGIWYWIIRADTYEWRGATPGDPFWFNVLPIPQFSPPRIIQPADKEGISMTQLTRDRNITFSWNRVDGANAYIFSLYLDESTPVLLHTASPQAELTFVLDDFSILHEGDYFWQVEAVYRNRTGVIEQRGIIVQHPFTIELQRSSNFQTNRMGTTYGQ